MQVVWALRHLEDLYRISLIFMLVKKIYDAYDLIHLKTFYHLDIQLQQMTLTLQ